MSNEPKPPENSRTVRWWPAALILVGAVLWRIRLCFVPHVSQQEYNIEVAKVIVVTILLLLLWVMGFSRMRWRARWTVFGLTIGGFALLPALFRIHGVSGNLVPILEPRWVRREIPQPAA